jgi:hypothetical protein
VERKVVLALLQNGQGVYLKDSIDMPHAFFRGGAIPKFFNFSLPISLILSEDHNVSLSMIT